jgi:glutamate synthase (NADPH/NADH) large chain
MNGLRDRIVVQADGQMKTGRDVVIAALLGAEEFGFATAPLVVSGCVMMRVCHLDTCPVGIATQNPELRSRFSGEPEFVVNFFEFIAQEVRELMAQLGFRTIDEMIGRVDALDIREAVDHWKAADLDISPILELADNPYHQSLHCTTGQDHGLEDAMDNELILRSRGAIASGQPVRFQMPIRNVNRTVGTMLGNEITRVHQGAGLAQDTITVDFTGSAGQSFGAFIPSGLTLRLTGDANDYVGKGLSGGRIVIAPPPESPFVAEEHVIAGNVIGYGATSGELFIRGVVGERFCVRNSGAVAVVEAIGDHGCEYMTGGEVVVLGSTGRNFGAGMSGGIAYVYDRSGDFDRRVNPEMVAIEVLDSRDRERLHELVQRHFDETGSQVAARLLASWSVEVSRFRKVMPTDYRRVLEVMDRAAADGLNEDEMMVRVMEAANG